MDEIERKSMLRKKTDKKKKERKGLALIRRLIIALLILFFFILFFLLLLPKEPDIIKGVTYDLKYPKISHYSQIPAEVFENDFKLMKGAGVNTIRLYSQPPEFILDLADKYRIKVIETIVFPGDWTNFASPYQLQALKREAIRNINRDIERDCIYAWSIWNDAPWTYGSGRGDVIKVYGKKRVSDFLRELYIAVKKRDPLRPVTAATLTIDEEAKSLGADFLDILGYNIYLGITDWSNGHYDSELAGKMVDELAAVSKKYEKDVLIAETGYSTYWLSEPQENAIRDQIEKVDRKLRGIILFQWADDWSKSGDVTVQNDNVEEHWGILEGDRKLKGGYYAAKQIFSNTLFRDIMLAISDYCRGTYFAAKKRALRKEWKEDIIIDSDIERLQNELSLKPSSIEVPLILERLSKMFIEKRGFNQLAKYLEEYRSSYKDSEYKGLIDYYIALARWNKLEYLAENRLWELYYAEKTRELDKILGTLMLAEEEAGNNELYLKILHLEWVIHNDLVDGKENSALVRLEEAIKRYSETTKNIEPLLTYSQLFQNQGEVQVSEKLLRAYVANMGKIGSPDKAASTLKEKAGIALAGGDFGQARILYDAYLNIIIRNSSEEDASFAMLELADLYRRRSLFDDSIEVCERLLKEFPSSELADDASYAVGVVLKEKKLYSKAIKAFRDFIIKFPDSDLSKSAIKETLSIFTVYAKEVRVTKTITFLKEIIALYPDSDFSIMARFELASSLASLGRREEAVREYQYIIENHPDSEYAKYSIRNIERLATGE